MPELGTTEAASLAGIALVAGESDRWSGHAFIRCGRATVRPALYMPALVAMRFSPQLKVKYERRRAAGRPAKVAITAIMRNLTLANALIWDGPKWAQSRP